MDFNEYFEYREGKLFWRSSPSNSTKAGSRAGSKSGKKGHRTVNLFGKKYMEHRVIWEMHNGPIPEGMYIDHIDQNASNNLLSNMRIVTMTENNRNRGLGKNNTSGHVGVRFEDGRWRSRIRVNGKTLNLGSFKNYEDACIARIAGQEKHGFHKNHGMVK